MSSDLYTSLSQLSKHIEAARRGDSVAQREVGQAFSDGVIIKHDDHMASFWLYLSEESRFYRTTHRSVKSASRPLNFIAVEDDYARQVRITPLYKIEEAAEKAEQEVLRKREEEERRRKAEEERMRREAEAKRKREEEERRRAEEKRRRDVEQKRKEEETRRRAAEIEAKRRAEEEARRKAAEEARRKELEKQIKYIVIIKSVSNSMLATMTARSVLNWTMAESKQRFCDLPYKVLTTEDEEEAENLCKKLTKGGMTVMINKMNGNGVRVDNSIFNNSAQISFDVILVDCGSSKLQVLKELMLCCHIGLTEANDLADGVPATIKKRISRLDALKIKQQFEEVGAKVTIK